VDTSDQLAPPAQAVAERRKNVRYQVSANAVFSWKGAGHARLRAEGVTRDISPLGAFIRATSCPPVDAEIQVDIFVFFPAVRGADPSIRIRAEAQVLRVDYSADRSINGFSVSCSRFRFWPRRVGNSTSDLSKWLNQLKDGGSLKGCAPSEHPSRGQKKGHTAVSDPELPFDN
jgi:PilZ domain